MRSSLPVGVSDRASHLAALALLVASLALFVHHATPAVDGMDGAAHTCVAVAAHVVDAAATSVAIIATGFIPLLLVLALSPPPLPSRRLLRTRAGPVGQVLPLRC